MIDTDPYFLPEERVALYAMLHIGPKQPEVQEDKEIYKISIEADRDAPFRIEVVVIAYRHICALTGYRMTTLEMESIGEAAHIHEFRDSRNLRLYYNPQKTWVNGDHQPAG